MGVLDFNPQTAYASDWQYFDDVVEAKYHTASPPNVDTTPRPTNQTVKVRPLSINSREFQQFSSAVGLNPTDRGFVIWKGAGNVRDIQSGDRLVTGDDTWTITNAQETNRSYWVVGATETPVNEP